MAILETAPSHEQPADPLQQVIEIMTQTSALFIEGRRALDRHRAEFTRPDGLTHTQVIEKAASSLSPEQLSKLILCRMVPAGELPSSVAEASHAWADYELTEKMYEVAIDEYEIQTAQRIGSILAGKTIVVSSKLGNRSNWVSFNYGAHQTHWLSLGEHISGLYSDSVPSLGSVLFQTEGDPRKWDINLCNTADYADLSRLNIQIL